MLPNRLYPGWDYAAAGMPISIPCPVGNTCGQIALEVSRELELTGILYERGKDIVHNVLGNIRLVQQRNSQSQQIVSVLFIDPAESIFTAMLEFPH